MTLALALFLAAVETVLVDDVIEVPASRTRRVELSLRERVGLLECEFSVQDPRGLVRVALVRRPDRAELAATEFEHEGSLRFNVRDYGDYRLVLDNRRQSLGAAPVRLLVRLISEDGAPARAVEAPPPRRRMVVWISLALFAGVILYAAVKLLPAIGRRRNRR